METSIMKFKSNFLSKLISRDIWYRRVSNEEYLTRCPYCGDTQKKLNDGHFYIKCNTEDNYPILYNCFKCDTSGALDKSVLDKLDMSDIELVNDYLSIKDRFSDIKYKKYEGLTEFIIFDYILPDINKHKKKLEYINDRLDIELSNDDIKNMRIITSINDFLKLNNIKKKFYSTGIMKILERDYIGFLSLGNSHIILRDTTNNNPISWIKYPITEDSKKNPTLYSISSNIDIFSNEDIIVNISEGIFDIISIYKNLNNTNITTCNFSNNGKDYKRILGFLISQGIFGYNVKLNIYSDNDEVYNIDGHVYSTTIDYYKNTLYPYLPLFKDINIYYNLVAKDCGVPKNKIRLKGYSLLCKE